MSDTKDTIYIDVDDEITSIIDKLQNAKSDIVALVLPKRAAVLQSMVNMKLLKRASDNANKRLVLITSEAGLLPMAGAAGVYVAKNLQTAPEIPSEPDVLPPDEQVVDATPAEPQPETGSSKDSSNSSSSKSNTKSSSKPSSPEETIDVDNDDAAAADTPKVKPEPSKKNKVPNFEKFRKRVIIGAIIMAAIIAAWVFAAILLPKATVLVQTNTSTVDSTFDFTANPDANELNVPQRLVPAKQESVSKTDSQKAAATGKKDIGTKATGSITVKNCQTSDSQTLSANSKFTSDGGKVFLTNSATAITPVSYNGGVICGNTTIAVTAAENGENYNIASASYSNGDLKGSYTNTGSAMAGGTSKVVTIVTQSDINTAKQKLASNDQIAKDELTSKLKKDGYYPITDTFSGGKNAKISTSANVGGQADEVTVTSNTTYTMTGIKEDDLKKLIDDNVKSSVETGKQKVQDYGLDQATFKITGADANGKTTITFNSQVAIGPDINQEQLKIILTGKKKGEAETILKALPGVKDATVNYSPFWVTKMPKPSKVTIILEKAN